MRYIVFPARTLLIALTLSTLLPTLARTEPKTVHLTLVLTCDIYEMTEQNGRGGFARLQTVIKSERARNNNVIVAHAGDAISPSLFSGFDQGAHIIDLTNMLSLDAFAPGNHEFDFGEKVYRQRMSEARFPILAANLRDSRGARLPGHSDYKIFDFDGVKVALIGLTADNSPQKSSPGNLRFAPTVATLKRLAPQLRQNGADLVVALAHAGRRQDLRIFYAHVVDILLSGDDHDLALLYDGTTAMVEAKEEAQYVTAIDLEIAVEQDAAGKRRVRWWPRFRIIDTADVTPDPKVTARVAHYQKMVDAQLNVELGRTSTQLDSHNSVVRTREAAIGNLITDAFRQRFAADVAIMNGGGIRANRSYISGSPLTRRDILKELPFGNKLYLVEMTGADLLAALENGLWFAGKPNGRFPQVSGLKITVKTKSLPGARIASVMVGGKPLDPKKTYKVATNDFIASGKEGYDAFKNATELIGAADAPLIANVVMSHIRMNGTVSPVVEGRIVFN